MSTVTSEHAKMTRLEAAIGNLMLWGGPAVAFVAAVVKAG